MTVVHTAEARHVIYAGSLTRTDPHAACDDPRTVHLEGHSSALPADQVTVLPQPGDQVTTAAGHQATWIGPLVQLNTHVGDTVQVAVLADGDLLIEVMPVAACHTDRITTGTADPLTRGMAETMRQVIRDHHQWKQQLTLDAHDHANAHSLCSDFDDFMQEHGLDRRSQDYELEVDITATVYLTRTARSLHEAIEALSTATIIEALGDDPGALHWQAQEND